MPIMPRLDKRAEDIAWKILGKPNNMVYRRTQREIAIDKRIDYQVLVGGR